MMNLLLIIIFSLFSVNALATELNVSLNHKVTEGKVYFQGKTNLPSNTKIGINLSSSSSYYSAQDYDIFIKNDGSFISAGFSNKGKSLSGNYTAKIISYANKFWQNADILMKLKSYTGYGIEDENMLIIYNFSIDSSGEEKSSSLMPKGPECTKSTMWEFVVNNACRTADEYAVNHNSKAVFIGSNVEIDFIKQYDGEFNGLYLLKIYNRHGGNTSLAMLLPLFDENASSESLNDEGQLWKVIMAKYNGREF